MLIKLASYGKCYKHVLTDGLSELKLYLYGTITETNSYECGTDVVKQANLSDSGAYTLKQSRCFACVRAIAELYFVFCVVANVQCELPLYSRPAEEVYQNFPAQSNLPPKRSDGPIPPPRKN